jgi:hypothetical protein
MTTIARFPRPGSYQGFPDELPPEPLKQADPHGVPRLVNGDYVRGKRDAIRPSRRSWPVSSVAF